MDPIVKTSNYLKDKIKSLLALYVSDVDFTSVYPSVMRGANVARDTFVSAIFHAGTKKETLDIQDLSSRAINTRENATAICSDFLNLPNYDELEKLLDKEFGDKA